MTGVPVPCPAAVLDRMRDEVWRFGFTFVSREATKSLLTSESIESWDAFAESWNDLGADTYMADGGCYRRRRHAVFQLHRGALLRREHQPHFQSRDYNPLNGGVQRWFEPIGATVGASILLRDLIFACGRLIAELEYGPENVHRIEVHQFRIEPHVDEVAFPTPEGVHRDGVDWVCVILIKRLNVSGGATSIADMTGKEIESLMLANELDMVFLDDRRLAHAVAPIRRMNSRRPGFRDALVITFVAQLKE